MKLIAKKPCSFGGKKFYIGEEIPSEFVVSPHDQEKMGVLVIVNDDAGTTPPAVDLGDPAGDITVVPVIVRTKDGDATIILSPESVQTVVDVLTANAEEAAELVKQIDNDDILFLLHAADSRKTVQAAAKARAQALAEEASKTEEPENPEESAGDQ